MLRILYALVAAAPLAAADPKEAPASPGPAQPGGAAVCQIVAIGSPQAPHRQSRFSATRIVELEFETRLGRRVSREHTLQLRVYTPQGFLYQVLELPLAASGTPPPTAPGERSAHEDRTERRPGRLMARLPVAGTSIMASALYGRWKVVPHLDDQSGPCGPGRSFVIQP